MAWVSFDEFHRSKYINESFSVTPSGAPRRPHRRRKFRSSFGLCLQVFSSRFSFLLNLFFFAPERRVNTKNDVRPISADKNGKKKKMFAVAVVNESRRNLFVFASPLPPFELFKFLFIPMVRPEQFALLEQKETESILIRFVRRFEWPFVRESH